MPKFMRLCGVREMMGMGRGVEFLLGLKKLLLSVLFSISRSCMCEHQLGISEMRIFSSCRRRCHYGFASRQKQLMCAA